MNVEEKKCSKCKRLLVASQFSKNRWAKDGYCHYCKECDKTKREDYYSKNKDKLKESARKWHQTSIRKGIQAYNNMVRRCTNPKTREYQFYGANGIKCLLTKEEFLQLYFSQNCCSLCGITLDDTNRHGINGRSLDRIDNQGNYEKGNLQIVCHSCNSSKNQIGEQNSKAKLTEAKVIAIRGDRDNKMSVKEIGRKYSTPIATVYAIISRRTWRHI